MASCWLAIATKNLRAMTIHGLFTGQLKTLGTEMGVAIKLVIWVGTPKTI